MKAPTLFKETDDGDEEIALPFKWEICGSCDGHNRSTAHVEHDGGGITASEMDELGEDFREDYFAGVYDRPCPHCEGGKVKVADRSRMSKADWKAYVAQEREEREYERTCRYERMMGA